MTDKSVSTIYTLNPSLAGDTGDLMYVSRAGNSRALRAHTQFKHSLAQTFATPASEGDTGDLILVRRDDETVPVPVLNAFHSATARIHYVATVGGTADAITLTPTIPITAYAAGQRYTFIASGTNTTNVTVNVSAVGAKAIVRNDGANTALSAGDIVSGQLVDIEYDGTRFQMMNWASAALGKWSTYTPSVASVGGAITSYTIQSARYQSVGKTVLVCIQITITNNGTGSTAIDIGLPFTASAPAFVGGINVTTVASVVGSIAASGTAATCYKYDGTYPAATNDVLRFGFVYERT